jgi:hypothetical protein
MSPHESECEDRTVADLARDFTDLTPGVSGNMLAAFFGVHVGAG